MNKNNIITGILLLIVAIGWVAHIKQDKERERRLIEQTNDLQFELEQTATELRRTANTRDSLRRSVDSLMANIQGLTTSLKQKDIEIKNIRGRYDAVPVDSLANLMNTRAWKRKGN